MRGWIAEILAAIKLNAILCPEDLSVIRTYRQDDHRKVMSLLSDSGSSSQDLEELEIFFSET